MAKKGLDRRIEAKAASLGVTISGLDEPEAMLALFADHPLEDQVSDMEAGALLMNHNPDLIIALTESYFDGSFQIGWEVGMQSGREAAERIGRADWLEAAISEMEHDLLTARNQMWIEKLIAPNAPAKVVVAVGAAHLPGKTGLLSLFEQEGWQITPLALDLP